MEVFEGHRALFRPLASAAIAIGNFDGVHIGHQKLLAQARHAADRLAGDAVALTFEPHPSALLGPQGAPPRLTTIARKQELFDAAGMSATVVEPFDASFAQLSASRFEEEVLRKSLSASHVVVGHDFQYGAGRGGNLSTLRAAGSRLGFTVEGIEPVLSGDHRASSSEIRRLLIAGDLGGAETLLGRAYDVDGVVARGAGRGGEFGIPTANVDTAELLLPRPGIYATLVEILGEPTRYMAATSLGTNPTFVQGGALTLEAHLLDFEGDLYERHLRVTFVQWLRAEERYDGVDALLTQIRKDIENTRSILGATR